MKNKKKLVILTIILILMQISIFSGNVIAEIVNGSKDGISWSYDSETKKLTFSGSGEIDDGWHNGINILEITTIEILDGVTSIGEYAFFECTGLTSIKIPNSVTSIGESAFIDCLGLTSINVSESNQNYCSEGGVLYNKDKTKLMCYPREKTDTTYEIPYSVTSIGNDAFLRCTGLTDIRIPDSVTSIGKYAFSGCSGLTSIEISNSVTSIGEGAFYQCTGLTDIKIPDSVTSIGNDAFAGCSGLTSIEIPNSVTSIGEYAFNACRGLTSIEVPDSMTSIGNYVFHDCTGLIDIEIPNSVTSIGKGAFDGCTGLTDIEIPDSVISIGDYAFNNYKSNIAIPDSVTSIGWDAFMGYWGLKIYCKSNSIAQQYAREKGIQHVIDDTPPIITELVQEGAYIKITATDNEGGVGLATSPYSIDSKNWQSNHSIGVNETREYIVYVKDKIGNITNKKINIDMDKPVIIKIDTDGKKIIINAKDELSGLAKEAYSLDGEKWQESNEITVEKDGRYMVYVRDKAGNIAKKLITVSSTSSQTNVIENNTGKESKDIQKNAIDTTVAPEKFGQFGKTKRMILIISLISVFGIIAKMKLKKYRI